MTLKIRIEFPHIPQAVSSRHFQEKCHQNLEHQRRLQELSFIKEEKRQLGNELEALRSKDKHIREWISRLEQILNKVKHIYACLMQIFRCYSSMVLGDLTFKTLNFKVTLFCPKNRGFFLRHPITFLSLRLYILLAKGLISFTNPVLSVRVSLY